MEQPQPLARMRRAAWAAVIVLALIGVAIVVRRTAQLVPILVRGYQPLAPAATGAPPQLAALDDIFARYPVLTLVHIVPGVLFMLLAPLQLSAVLRARHRRWHRWSGRVVVVCGLVIGVSALGMSVGMPAIGGVNQAAATLLFGVVFLFALGAGFRHIRRGDVARHREWMIRAFSIGLAVATIRPIVGLFFATSRLSGLAPNEFFGTAFWIGFVLHLIAAEVWIHATRLRIADAARPQ